MRRCMSRERQHQRVVSVNVPTVQAQYFAAILGGISEALDAAGIELLLHPAQSRLPLADRLAPGTADGAILVLPPESLDELQELQRSSIPFAVIDPRVSLDAGFPCVAAANAAGARRATEYLLGLGHSRIALGHWSIGDGYDAACRLLALGQPPTAIFAFNDEMAIGALRAARESGVRVPADLSIVGFDDVDRAGLVSPPLTTVRQPLAEMGRVAVSLLLRLLEERRVDALRLELATRLVVRESTAAPAA